MSFEGINDADEQHERRITRCRGCGARIVFLTTDSGKKTPVDADTVEPEDEEFEWGRHESHFAKCPQSGQFRRSR